MICVWYCNSDRIKERLADLLSTFKIIILYEDKCKKKLMMTENETKVFGESIK